MPKFKNTIHVKDRMEISPENCKVLDDLVLAARAVNGVMDDSASGNLDYPIPTEELQCAFLNALIDSNKTRWERIINSIQYFQRLE